jgi:hypothetical protein
MPVGPLHRHQERGAGDSHLNPDFLTEQCAALPYRYAVTKCDLAGVGVMLMIWAFAFLIWAGFEKQHLGELGNFALLVLGIAGVWVGINVRKQCKERGS